MRRGPGGRAPPASSRATRAAAPTGGGPKKPTSPPANSLPTSPCCYSSLLAGGHAQTMKAAAGPTPSQQAGQKVVLHHPLSGSHGNLSARRDRSGPPSAGSGPSYAGSVTDGWGSAATARACARLPFSASVRLRRRPGPWHRGQQRAPVAGCPPRSGHVGGQAPRIHSLLVLIKLSFILIVTYQLTTPLILY